ncbi:hypothetical protein DICVIV_06698 [Dictyocaulus viviparus]|uniref:Uncharacterized protein n=1 Tax=Dictyocaulus viviparus TaxID=29172 RepID=A0A0D8XU24_DICVI|nr:hypothetical protein DICVIV_06698 [Dictyocaulus viviparus]
MADMLTSINYMFFVTVRSAHLLDDFFWRYQSYYIASWCFSQYFFSVVIRILGILFITVHRYATICCDGSTIEHYSPSFDLFCFLVILNEEANQY